MTDSDNKPPQTPLESEAQASLRADILQQIADAHANLDKVLAQLGSGDVGRIQIALQLTNLSALRQQAGTATGAMLQQMKAEVATSLANAQSLASGGSGTDSNAASVTLAKASAKARQTAQDFLSDYYDKHEFDKYLEFQSKEDERTYREREAARQREIQEALAANTPEGNLRADQLGQAQLLDAGAHGADRSPDYPKTMTKLKQASEDLNAAITGHADSVQLPPEAEKHITALRAAGVTVADQSQQGHGVTVDASIAALLGRA